MQKNIRGRADKNMNKVISREYVEENYIKKDDLQNFIDGELMMIEKCRKDVGFISNQQYDGMEAVYKTIKNLFLEGTKDANK